MIAPLVTFDQIDLGQAPASHADRAKIANVLRKRGKAVSAALTKTYR